MRHQKTGRKLSRRKAHRTAMLANLAASIIKHGTVRTTEAKAKEVRPFVERLITFARSGTLHDRRIVLSRLHDPEAVRKLFAEVGPTFSKRNGGYTRILKLGFRVGDNAPVSLIQLVEEKAEGKAMKKPRPKRQKTAAPAPAAEETSKQTKADKAGTAPEETAEPETAEVEEVTEAAPGPETGENTKPGRTE